MQAIRCRRFWVRGARGAPRRRTSRASTLLRAIRLSVVGACLQAIPKGSVSRPPSDSAGRRCRARPPPASPRSTAATTGPAHGWIPSVGSCSQAIPDSRIEGHRDAQHRVQARSYSRFVSDRRSLLAGDSVNHPPPGSAGTRCRARPPPASPRSTEATTGPACGWIPNVGACLQAIPSSWIGGHRRAQHRVQARSYGRSACPS